MVKFSVKQNSGVAALPTVLLIGGLIVELGLAGVLIAYLLSQSSFGAKLSAEALAAASSGVEDATLKIVRDKSFSSPGYNLTVGNRSAYIVVCKDTCVSGKYQVISTGSALAKKRKLEAIINVDGVSGEAIIESIQEKQL